MGRGVGVAGGNDRGRALVLLVVVEVEQVGGGEALLIALYIVGLCVDGEQVLVCLLCPIEFFFGGALLRAHVA